MLTVSDLNRKAKLLLEGSFNPVWVEGEITNFKHHSSGHMYFTLKDARAQLAAVMFAGANAALAFRPGDGQRVVARGRLTLYEVRGQYQLVAENLYPAGEGALWLKFEALRDSLKQEGLFDLDRKQPLPSFPQRVGVISSPTGAAIHDILNVLGRRAPHVTALVRPTRVQGDSSAEDVAAAIKDLTDHGSVDLLIIARGGGSLEDLWAFNEEVVVRAVAACPLPTISAVGHETDVTLCDLVADVRAPTPSAAAELAVPERDSFRQLVDDQTIFLETLVVRRLADMRRQLEVVEDRHGLHQPLARIARRFEILHERGLRLDQGILRLLKGKGLLATAWTDRLSVADPENILKRGYIMVSRKADGQAVTRKRQVVEGEELLLRFTDGTVGAVANERVASS